MTSGGNRLLQTNIASEHDHVSNRCTRVSGDRLQHSQHGCETVGLVAGPVLLRCKTDAGAVGPAALVRVAEGPCAVPRGGDHVSRGQAAGCDLRLDGDDVVAAAACWDRILPDQVFGGDVRAVVVGAWAHVAVGQLEPRAAEGIGEVVRVSAELLADFVVNRVCLHRHVSVGHQRHGALGRVGRVDRHFALRHIHRLPLVGTGRRLGQLPLVAEEVVEVAHVPLGRVLTPRAFDAGGKGVGRLAVVTGVGPAKALPVDGAALGLSADVGVIAATVSLADGVTATGQCRGLFVVHRHAAEGFTHVQRGQDRVGVAVDALGVDVDQAHVNRCQRVLHGFRHFEVAVAVLGWRQPLVLGAPVNVLFRPPDVFTAEAEAEGLQAHGLVSHVTGEDHQIGPGQGVAVLLFHRPEQAAGLVEAGVVRPRVQRGKADVARPGAAASVAHAVGARRVPRQTDHQAAVVAPVRRPPRLAVGQQCLHVCLHAFVVQRLHRFPVIVVRIHRVGAGIVLVQDVEVEGLRPPLGDRVVQGRVAAVHYRAAATHLCVTSVHLCLS